LTKGGAWRWVLAVGFAIALGGGAWFYDVFGPKIRALWPHWKVEGRPWIREALLWIEFLASISLSIAVLCWCTALLFSLLCAMLFSLPHLVGWLRKRFRSQQRLTRMQQHVDKILGHDRLLGTVLNVLASAGALAVLMVIRKRPPDYWDVGIQVAVTAAIELIVLQILFVEGRFRWPTRTSPPDP
jgi:hypothetical protein